MALIITLCWFIWKGRNRKIFEDQDPQLDHTLALALRDASDTWNELNTTSSPGIQDSARGTGTPRTNWLPPPEGFLKSNSDACYDDNLHICSIGVLIRDEFGIAHSGVAKILPALSPLHAESLAMKEAHALASNLGIQNIVFEIDNHDLYSYCKNKESHWQIYSVMKEIEVFKEGMDSVAYYW